MLKITNELLRDDILAELDADPRVDATRIGVAVEDGVVTLTGTVPYFPHKWSAEQAAKRVNGVVAVVQELTVDLPAMHMRNDGDIAHAIADALTWNISVPDTVQATVHNGYVTLSGVVDWNYEREEAESVTRRIAGVRGINNTIGLRPSVPPKDIRNKIRSIFQRDAQIDANHVIVETAGGEVTLTGTVHSLFERDEAARAAWLVKGVTEVENQLSLA